MSDMVNFIQWMEIQDLLERFRTLNEFDGNEDKLAKIVQRVMREGEAKFGERFMMAGLKHSEKSLDFTAVVIGRGTVGRHRTILLRQLRVFGIKHMILTDHIWAKYTRPWIRIEPFLQGQRVFINGRIQEYQRGDESVSYNLAVRKVFKL